MRFEFHVYPAELATGDLSLRWGREKGKSLYKGGLPPWLPKARLEAVPANPGFGHHLGALGLPCTAGQRCGGPGMCVHKDEECLFFPY